MCDTVVAVLPDRVLFAKNSDRDPNEAQPLLWEPRQDHAPGESLQCTWIAIPQVARTHAVLLSRPFWQWGAEMGANEHGVVIGNEAVFTWRRVARQGLTGMDLVRLALERADSATAAVDIICELIETVGQGGGSGHEDRDFRYHNSFLIADPRGAFVLETADRAWVVERVTGARAISNGLTIEPFASKWKEPVKTLVAAAQRRRSRTEAGACQAAGPGDFMRILRDHGPTEDRHPTYSLVNGGMAAPCMHAGGMVAASQTTASWVSELDASGAHHWVTGTSAPCVSLFKPITVTSPLDLGPPATDHADLRCLWWRHEQFQRLALRDPARTMPGFIPERDAVEARWLAKPPDPPSAWAEADRLLAAWTAPLLDDPPEDRRPWWVKRYWRVRDVRAGLDLPRPS